MEDCQLVLYIQEHGISSNEESQSQEKHGMRRQVFSPNTNESFEVRLTSVLQPQFDGQCAVDDVNVGTVSSSLLQKQDFGDLSHRTDVRARRS